jgi:hypothetical protein
MVWGKDRYGGRDTGPANAMIESFKHGAAKSKACMAASLFLGWVHDHS